MYFTRIIITYLAFSVYALPLLLYIVYAHILFTSLFKIQYSQPFLSNTIFEIVLFVQRRRILLRVIFMLFRSVKDFLKTCFLDNDICMFIFNMSKICVFVYVFVLSYCLFRSSFMHFQSGILLFNPLATTTYM